MKPFAEQALFIRQLMAGATDLGAFLPTSRFTGRAMSSEAARKRGHKRILEVGSGTGPITREIAAVLEPGDELVCCDINVPFMNHLERRFETDPELARVRHQVRFTTASVLDLDEFPKFDYIISALPFTRMGAELTTRILDKYKRMLKPNGVLSYIEYAWLRGIKDAITARAGRIATSLGWEASDSTSQAVQELLARHEFRRDEVLRNVPPAWIHHLRFEPPLITDALDLRPPPGNSSARLGQLRFDTDAAKFVAAGIGGAWLLRRKGGAALLPLAAATAAVWFLRDPARTAAENGDDEAAVYSACDGRVLSIEIVADDRFGAGNWLRIATFLDITDVHVNRSPISGRVEKVVHQAGGHAIASRPEAEANAASFTVIEGFGNQRAIVAQRVGAVARRIVNRARPGALISRGEKFGLIRFGSRTDVYLPAGSVDVLVEVGDVIRAGDTIIARFK